MNRREFLELSTAALACSWLPLSSFGENGATLAPPPAPATHNQFDDYFLRILEGFLRNAKLTTPTYALCDYPQGTHLKGCVANHSGKTYVSVARMLPAMAAWLSSPERPREVTVGVDKADLTQVLLSIYRHGFDPKHEDFWGNARTDKPDQRQVEASLVAWALWILGKPFVSQLSAQERSNVQAWLAGCTRVVERKHNHAWFSAINQAVRLELSRSFKEFSGDEAWMLEDLKALDSMAVDQGWYNDWQDGQVFDYYNFWTFASHFLYWNVIIGARYPELQARFLSRLKSFLQKTPFFFASNGSHVLFGRSLIYRWALLTPLVQSYRQGLWPHSPGLLRRIVRKSFEFHWGLSPYDDALGKLRESYSSQGSHDVTERYVDNGHPYWCMQAFELFRFPENDPFWTAEEEPLPIEREDFHVDFPKLGMLLHGVQRSGHVQWFQSRNIHKATYRDKYIKLGYSSHFPFNVLDDEEHCPWDSNLVFQNPATGQSASRSVLRRGELCERGLVSAWLAELGSMRFDVKSRLVIDEEFVLRLHEIIAPPDAIEAGICVLEGSYPLGLKEGELPEKEQEKEWMQLRSAQSGMLVASWALSGYGEPLTYVQSFEESGRKNTNLLAPQNAVITLKSKLAAQTLTLASLHYASPKPRPRQEILERATALKALLPKLVEEMEKA